MSCFLCSKLRGGDSIFHSLLLLPHCWGHFKELLPDSTTGNTPKEEKKWGWDEKVKCWCRWKPRLFATTELPSTTFYSPSHPLLHPSFLEIIILFCVFVTAISRMLINWSMQKKKTTIRYHFIPWLLFLEKLESKNCWHGCEEVGTLVRCWGQCILTATVESGWQLLKNLNNELAFDPAIPLLCIHLKTWRQGPELISVHLCSQQPYT